MNFLCPICDNTMAGFSKNVYFCKEDVLYFCDDYRPTYYNADYLLHYKLYGKTDFGKKLNAERWRFVLEKVSSGNLLDFGCGSDSFTGTNPGHFKTFSYDPFFKPNYDFLQVDLDVVTFWDSFEHLTRLEIVPLLNSRWIFLSIPILKIDADLFSWKHFRPGEHLWYFSDDALIRLFEKWGYSLRMLSDFESLLGRKDIRSYCFEFQRGEIVR